MKPLLLLTATLSVCLFGACTKSESVTPPAAALTVAAPVPHQVYHFGDTMHVRADVSFELNLHGSKVLILRNATGDTLLQAADHTHATQLTVSQWWVDTLAAPEELTVIVSSTINHEGAEVSRTVPVQVQP